MLETASLKLYTTMAFKSVNMQMKLTCNYISICINISTCDLKQHHQISDKTFVRSKMYNLSIFQDNYH